MSDAYLTIDDGASERFTDMIDALHQRGVPAVFFNRGDAMEANRDAVLYGIERGYIMANHAYSHRRFSKLALNKCFEEIQKTENILDALYKKVGVARGAKYFRFPYMDRGMGSYLIEPENLADEHRAAHHNLVGAGLGHDPALLDEALIEKKCALQDFLKADGFEPLPTPNVKAPWYAQTEMARAIDSLCTFSTSDWALSSRHIGKHGFDTIEDLKAQIDNDVWLQNENSAHIILAHDQPEIFDVTIALVDYFLQEGFTFLDFQSNS